MLRNIRLKIEYDGTDFSGWQVQPDLRTVQGEIESGLSTILKEKISLTGAGRTDVGVHALGQVANFKTDSELELEAIKKALNGFLPDDIAIKKTEEVELSFNSRYSAKSREYHYRIGLVKSALFRRYVWEVSYSLNPEMLTQATSLIIGQHDFTSFCMAGSTKESNLCNIKQVFWERSEDELIFKIEADRFLHTMVRSLVGTLIEVARGYFTIADFSRIMDAHDRKKAGPTAPAHGLYLAEVKY
jgi:tRNA pseudouridine38-40 synthase